MNIQNKATSLPLPIPLLSGRDKSLTKRGLLFMEKICGIYKITSPSGKIYIGQSVNIYKRIRQYKNLFCKDQPRLYHSLKKYGWEEHKFEVIHGCNPDELNALEVYYIALFQCFDTKHGLNLQSGGEGKICSEETRFKLSHSLKGINKGRFHSEETKRKISKSLLAANRIAWNKGLKMSDDFKSKISKSLIGNSYRKGASHSAETKLKMSQSGTGKKKPRKTKLYV